MLETLRKDHTATSSEMYYVLLYDLVDDYLTKREPFREAHYKLINDAHGRGELLISGLFVEPTDEALLVFAGPTSKNAEEFVKTDPYVKNGMVKSWRIRKWVTSVGPGTTMP